MLVLGLMVATLAFAAPGDGDHVLSRSSPEEAFRVGNCNLCHSVPGVDPPGRLASCTECHTWIRDVASDPARRQRAASLFPLWARYEQNTRSYLEVPSLQAAMARLSPEWVAGYLSDPHDLRPSMPETMPRFALDADQRAAIVSAFAEARVDVPPTAAPSEERVAEGAALFESKGCAGCHTFGALHTAARVPTAPDLAHARARLDPDMAAAWIADPGSISSAATMPEIPLSQAEVLALRDYVLLADPAWSEPGAPASVEPTSAPVSWSEVEERVFGRICVHCHMDPAQNEGRAGPGNGGGFGFAPTGIALQTYEQVVAAADRIPEALIRRRHEAARDHVRPGQRPSDLTRPEKPGMPLGLPPLSDDDLSLVLGWIAQGTPR